MREIDLSTLESVPHRVESLKRSLELIYQTKLQSESLEIPLERLYPTEDFLENDKLALVFNKIMVEHYDVPIIGVEHRGDYFVLDGHHRSYIHTKLQKTKIKAEALIFPAGSSYREISKSSFEDMPTKEVAQIDDSLLKAWARILNILREYEALYHVHFHMKSKRIYLKDLSPTQPQVLRTQIEAIGRLLVPIACIQHANKYYILDGHARCLKAKQLDLKSIKSIILSPETPIDFGIIRTAKEMNLAKLEDIAIIK